MTARSTDGESTPHMTDDQITERLADPGLDRRGFLRVGATTGVAAAALALPLAAVHGAALDRDSVHADHSSVSQAQFAQAGQAAPLAVC